MGTEWAHVTDYIIGAAQKIPEWLIRINFWGRSKLQLSQVLSLDLAWASIQVMPF